MKMKRDWQRLLDRILDGEELGDDSMDELRAALADDDNRERATAKIRFQYKLQEYWAPVSAHETRQSRERLLAKALLREKTLKRAGVLKSSNWSRPHRLFAGAGLAAAAMLIGFWVAWSFWNQADNGIADRDERPPESQHEPLVASAEAQVVSGQITAYRHGQPLAAGAPLMNGDRLVAGSEGAQLSLSEFCSLELSAETDLTLAGGGKQQAVHLHRGRLDSEITPETGSFICDTPLGTIRVLGTRFVTTVEPDHWTIVDSEDEFVPHPPVIEGAKEMLKMSRSAKVTLAVIAGAVAYELAGVEGTLDAGGRKVFAVERDERDEPSLPKTSGEVLATTDFTLTLKTAEGKEFFHADKHHKLAVHEVGQLLPGDEVTITWEEERGNKYIHKIHGRGQIRCKVVGKAKNYIEIQPDDGGPEQKFIPNWIGGMPRDGGGLDKQMLRKMADCNIGDHIVLTWEIPEGKRVVEIKHLD